MQIGKAILSEIKRKVQEDRERENEKGRSNSLLNAFSHTALLDDHYPDFVRGGNFGLGGGQ